MAGLTIQLPDAVTPAEARLELAIGLYLAARLTQGEAAGLAGCSRGEFLEHLSTRRLPFTNIDVQDLEEELATWQRLRSRTAPPPKISNAADEDGSLRQSRTC